MRKTRNRLAAPLTIPPANHPSRQIRQRAYRSLSLKLRSARDELPSYFPARLIAFVSLFPLVFSRKPARKSCAHFYRLFKVATYSPHAPYVPVRPHPPRPLALFAKPRGLNFPLGASHTEDRHCPHPQTTVLCIKRPLHTLPCSRRMLFTFKVASRTWERT